MRMSYQTALRAKGFKPLGKRNLRTERKPGSAEIVVGRDGSAKLLIYKAEEKA